MITHAEVIKPSTSVGSSIHLLKSDFDAAQKRWRALFAGEVIDRPVISIVAPRKGFENVPRPHSIAGHDGRIDEAIDSIESWVTTRYWGGDAVPCTWPNFGPDLFAAVVGAEMHFRPSEGTSWVTPFVENWADALPLRLDTTSELWQRFTTFMRRQAERARGRWIVGATDLHGNMDLLSAIRSPEKLCMDILDQPDLVERAMQEARRLFPIVSDALYEAGDMASTGSTGWIPMYSEKNFNVIQCDFICMISNEQFKTFVLPALREESEYFAQTIYHLDGPGALHHVDDILSLPRVNAVQWVPGAGAKPLCEWIDLLRKIQATKIVHICCQVDEIEYFHRQLGPHNVFYDCQAASEEEALRAVEWLEKNT